MITDTYEQYSVVFKVYSVEFRFQWYTWRFIINQCDYFSSRYAEPRNKPSYPYTCVSVFKRLQKKGHTLLSITETIAFCKLCLNSYSNMQTIVSHFSWRSIHWPVCSMKYASHLLQQTTQNSGTDRLMTGTLWMQKLLKQNINLNKQMTGWRDRWWRRDNYLSACWLRRHEHLVSQCEEQMICGRLTAPCYMPS